MATSFTRLGFAAVYNFDNPDEDAQKFRTFISLMQDQGASFCPELAGRFRVLDTAQMHELFGSAPRTEWIGRLFIPPRVLLQCVAQFTDSLKEANPSFYEMCSKWLNVARSLAEIYVTIDVPAPATPLPTVIAYWSAKPTFWPYGALRTSGEAGVDCRRAAQVLQQDLYYSVDNLFSALVFSWGGFSYSRDQLRKLAFIYFVSASDIPGHAPSREYAPLYETILGRDSRNLAVRSIAHDQSLVFAKGFVGMTGQPDVNRAPDLVLLATQSNAVNDARTLIVLRRLAAAEKSAYMLNESAAASIPALPSAFPTEANTPAIVLETRPKEGNTPALADRFGSLHESMVLEIIRRGSFLLTEFETPLATAPVRKTLEIVEIDPDVAARLKQGICAIDTTPYVDFERFRLESAEIFKSTLSPDTVDTVLAFTHDRFAPGSLLFASFPTDDDPGLTPDDGRRARNKKTFVSEGCLLGISALLGEPYGFEKEKEGEIIHNVCPVKGKESAKSNEGSLQDFFFHTEVAFHPLRPDFLMLVCIRQDHDRSALTHIVDVSAIVESLSREDLALLRQTEFIVHAPQSFGGGTQDALTAIMSGTDGSPRLRLNFNAMSASGAAAQEAMDRLRRRLAQERVARALAPGDLLLINNRRAVHGRNRFTPNYDGYDRWLQRLYVREGLWGAQNGLTYPARIVPAHKQQ